MGEKVKGSISRSSRKDHTRHKNKGDDAGDYNDSFVTQESCDFRNSSRVQEEQDKEPIENGVASGSHVAESKKSLGNFLQTVDFDASRAKSIGMDEDDEASRGAYSTASKLIKAKKRRKKILADLEDAPASSSRGKASAPKPTALDLLDVFLANNRLATLGTAVAADEEQSRGARSTMTGVIRRSARRKAGGEHGHYSIDDSDNKSQDDMVLNHRSSRGLVASMIHSRSRSRSRHRSSKRHSSVSRRQKSLTKESTRRTDSQEDDMNGSSSSLRDSMRKSKSLRDAMNSSTSSLRDSMKKSHSFRDSMNRSSSSLRDSRKSSSRRSTSRKAGDEKHGSRKDESTTTDSGVALTVSDSKEYEEISKRSSKDGSSKRKKDADDEKRTYRNSSAAEVSSSSRRRSSEYASSKDKSHSRRSSNEASASKVAVEQELMGLISALHTSASGNDPNEVDRDENDRRHKKSSTRRASLDSNTSNSDHRRDRRQRSSRSHRGESEKSSSHRIKSILKESKYREKSPGRTEGSKRRSSNKHDSSGQIELDEYGLISSRGRRSSAKEGRDGSHREKSPSRIAESRRRSTRDEKSKKDRDNSPSGGLEAARRRSSKHVADEEGKTSRTRSPSRNRHHSEKDTKERRSSRRLSSNMEQEHIDSDRKNRRRHSTRSDRELDRGSSHKRGRESRRKEEGSHRSHRSKKKKSSRRSMSVQPSSHGHRKHRRAHSVGPTSRSSVDLPETIAKAKEHFLSLLKGGSPEEAGEVQAGVIPSKILSIKGRFSGDEDDTLPRVEDKTPVSPGSLSESKVDDFGQDSLGSDAPALPFINQNAEDGLPVNDRASHVIDLTSAGIAPADHIDLTGADVDSNHEAACIGSPDSRISKAFESDDQQENGPTNSFDSCEREQATRTRRGIWGMIRSRIASSGSADGSKDEKEDHPESSSVSCANSDKGLGDSKHESQVHLNADVISDDMTAAMSVSQHSGNEKSFSGRDRSRSASPVHYDSSMGSVGSLGSSYGSLRKRQPGYTDPSGGSSMDRDIDESERRPASFPSMQETIDALAPPSFHGPTVDYEEEDAFTIFCWSVHRQDEPKILQARKMLRDSLQTSALHRAILRIKQ